MSRQPIPTKKITGFDDLWMRALSEGINHGMNGYANGIIPPSSGQLSAVSFSPQTPTEAFLVDSITITTLGNTDFILTLLDSAGPDYPALTYAQKRFLFKTGATSGISVPFRAIINTPFGFSIGGGDGTAAIGVDVFMNAQTITNDRNFNADKVILFIGDSIMRGTNIGGTKISSDGSNIVSSVSAEDHFTFQVKHHFQRMGFDCRQVNKAMGNYNSNQIEAWRKSGWLDIPQANAIFYMMGVNDAQDGVTDIEFTNNINKIIDLRDRRWPGVPIVLLGETQVGDDTRENRTNQFRNIMSSLAVSNSTKNVLYCSLADVIPNRKDLSYYTETSGNGVHPNVATNLLMSDRINDWLDDNNIEL